jgi:hypothetical protein
MLSRPPSLQKSQGDKSIAVDVPLQAPGEDQEYPTGLRLALLIFFVLVSMFLVGLDRLVISTVQTPVSLNSTSVMQVICP